MKKIIFTLIIAMALFSTGCDGGGNNSNGGSGSNGGGGSGTSDFMNQPPLISSIRNQEVILGDSIKPVNLPNYISDDNDRPEQMTATLSQSNPGVIDCYVEDLYIKSHESVSSGTNKVTITVKDSGGRTNQATFFIKVAPPPLIYTLNGLNFSPFVDGQDPNENISISEEQISQRMEVIAPYTRWIKTFGTTNGLTFCGKIARKFNLNVAMVAQLDENKETNQEEMENLIKAAKENHLALPVIGNEVLQRGDLTESELLEYINQFKQEVPWLPVSYAGSYTSLLDYPDIIEVCDIILANHHPYQEGISVENAVAHLQYQHKRLKEFAQYKQIWVSETGWPSDGAVIGEAVPSPKNACYYFLNFISWARSENVDYFYFEAFDQGWNSSREEMHSARWGVWNENGRLKECMEPVFQGETMEDNWTGAFFVGDRTLPPQIEITSVPSVRSSYKLKGRGVNLIPSDYGVAVYVKENGWQTKPYEGNQITPLNYDGTWDCDILSGGNGTAKEIAVFLVPISYSPPLMEGGDELPEELETNSVDSQIVQR